MSHSINKIWIHAIWATKERYPLINLSVETKFYQFISEQLVYQLCDLTEAEIKIIEAKKKMLDSVINTQSCEE